MRSLLIERALKEVGSEVERVITIDAFVDEIEMLAWGFGVEILRITQETKKGKKVIIVEDLRAEEEDGAIYCYDEAGAIVENSFVLMTFLKDQVIKFVKTYNDGKVSYKLQFVDVSILIEQI